MRSCCKQVKEFVIFGRQLHAVIVRLYETLGEHAELERVRMLLDFLQRHERNLETALARFEKNSRGGILEAWLEYSPSLNAGQVLDDIKLPEKPSSDDIFAAALKFDDTLIELYRELAVKAADHKTREVFQNLLKLEEGEKNQIVRAALSLQDM
ncbi:hypothetical protein F6R98_15015 [Candidatus Methylospira mobilis]|uniref:DUF2383 domain-containing protein n=1 Tax=Candidatus Methylospira mobilis TaxID=1808979 RepID=A0A5Q0BIY6_9GAMM|nr:hypothetical protein [Candidatus Methylospira mobilis]QFY43773.1 hypothetical protein F6R98_15015 [Candidatus Methylospira mobilis]